MGFPLSEKVSIAVLPFTNMSDDPKQEYFSDGISDDIITDLSKLSGLVVIARSSSFTYKGKTIGVQQIGQDLKVRYLLEGSVRKAGDRVRINAQLVETSTGQHLWAERYEGKMDDIFTFQDGITRNIVSALALKLTAREQEALADKGTDNLLAYDHYLKGWENYRQQTDESFARAKFHLEKAIELDPEFSRAYTALAIMYWRAVETTGFRQGLELNHWTKVMQAALKSRELLQKALKKPTALAHGLMSQFYLNMFLHNEALAEIERAIVMVPNSPTLYSWRSKILWLMGKDREAIESAKRAMRLDPNNPIGYLITLAMAYLPDGDLNECLTLLERAKLLNPGYSAYVALLQSIIYGLQGRTLEARAAFEFFRNYKPDVSSPTSGLQRLVTSFPFTDLKKSDRIADALRKAGAPGNSTDYCKVSRSNLLKGSEIKNLLFGHKINGIDSLTGEHFWQEWDRNGESISFTGGIHDKGKWWIEGNVLCGRLEKLTGGLLFTETIFRNPDGTKEQMNQYFFVNHARIIYYFSRAD
jgi:TolB-like protein